jgi:polysaccharide pyruvyl transferase WcaK-like protein
MDAVDRSVARWSKAGPESRAGRLLRLLTRRLPAEVKSFLLDCRWIGRGTTLSVTGTGVLETDSASINGLLTLLKWTLATRLRGGRVVFLSVGAGPAASRTHQWLYRLVLATAQYVSYRDQESLECISRMGIDTRSHHVFPDLAFSLPHALLPRSNPPEGGRLVVGVGVVDDSKFPDAEHYRAYLRQLSVFVVWLLDRGHRVSILHGDGKYDEQALADLAEALGTLGVMADDSRLRRPSIDGTHELLRELAGLDLVVASRYHNVILSLASGRPAIAASYHFKFSALLDTFRMTEYCIELPELSAEWLEARFSALSSTLATSAQAIASEAERLRPALARQYEQAFQARWPAAEVA